MADDGAKMAVLDYVIGTMDRHGGNILYDHDRPVAIDNGYSMPGPRTPDGFMFRSSVVSEWLSGHPDFTKEAREPVLQALMKTDWKAFIARHPAMSQEERDALLGRIETMKDALQTDAGLY